MTLQQAVRRLWRDRYYRAAGKAERVSIVREFMVNDAAGRDVRLRRAVRASLAKQHPVLFEVHNA